MENQDDARHAMGAIHKTFCSFVGENLSHLKACAISHCQRS